MEISRDKTAEAGGTISIRLHYSRQFQNAGHAHTIDAETTLAVGTSPERREQIIRELEAGVEQLVRQIQHAPRPTSEAYAQPAGRPAPTGSRTPEATAPAPISPPRAEATRPPAPLPVSESMPATPTTGGERTISLPQFLDFIKKRWNMSRQEAMELLNVRELTGLNLRDALFTLRSIKEPNTATNPGAGQTRPAPSQPVVEAPHQTNRGTPATSTRPPVVGQSTSSNAQTSRAQTPTGARQETPHSATNPGGRSSASSTMPDVDPPTSEYERAPQANFAASSKAPPLAIQFGVVRDISQRLPADRFDEEDDDEEYSLPDDDEEYSLPDDEDENDVSKQANAVHRQAAEQRLEKLREMHNGNGNAASPERLTVLHNVIGEQISGEQLTQLLKKITGSPNKKKLKIHQVEELISWAKEDYFAEEVSAILEPSSAEEN